MLRRQFLQWSTAAFGAAAMAQDKPLNEAVTANATQAITPRVGIVLSSFKGSADHDGTEVKGLKDPQPVTAALTQAHFDEMVNKAVDISLPLDGLESVLATDDWIVIKTCITTCHGLGPDTKDGLPHSPFTPGSVTDLRLIRSLLSYLVEHKCGRRITIVEGSPEWKPIAQSKLAVDGWTTDWGGVFGGLSYKGMVEDFSKRHPSIRFEFVDLNYDNTVESAVPGGALAKGAEGGRYHLPATIQRCDRVISVAPLRTHTVTRVALGIENFLGFAPGSKYGMPKTGLEKLGSRDEVMIDFYALHPADYVILGGSWGVEGDGPSGYGVTGVQHNVVIAGANAVAVDATAAQIMGFDPTAINHLKLAENKGFGSLDMDMVWTRGNEVTEARHEFRKPGKS